MSTVFTTTTDIDASTEAVWEVLTDFAPYGEWSNFSRVEGSAQVGTKLSIRMPGLSFKPSRSDVAGSKSAGAVKTSAVAASVMVVRSNSTTAIGCQLEPVAHAREQLVIEIPPEPRQRGTEGGLAQPEPGGGPSDRSPPTTGRGTKSASPSQTPVRSTSPGSRPV